MAEATTRVPTPAESGKDADDKKIAGLRKTYEDLAKQYSEAAQVAAVPVVAGLAELKAKKQKAFDAMHAAEEEKAHRERDAAKAPPKK